MSRGKHEGLDTRGQTCSFPSTILRYSWNTAYDSRLCSSPSSTTVTLDAFIPRNAFTASVKSAPRKVTSRITNLRAVTVVARRGGGGSRWRLNQPTFVTFRIFLTPERASGQPRGPDEVIEYRIRSLHRVCLPRPFD